MECAFIIQPMLLPRSTEAPWYVRPPLDEDAILSVYEQLLEQQAALNAIRSWNKDSPVLGSEGRTSRRAYADDNAVVDVDEEDPDDEDEELDDELQDEIEDGFDGAEEPEF